MVEVNGTDTLLTPSVFVDQMVGDLDDFKDYDFENDKVKKHVKVRDWLLAVAFPATTLPMGANPLGDKSEPWNIDMSKSCKANVDEWPTDDRPAFNGNTNWGWYHSDYKDLPYQYTFPFYKEISDRIK